MKSEARKVGLLLVGSSVLLLAAYQIPSDIFLAFGPNDGPYVGGFREEFEIDEPYLIHWSGRRGRVRLPFLLPRGPFAISFRYKRHTRLPADIRLFVAGQPVDRFLVPQQDFTVRTATVLANPRPWEPLTLDFLADSPDPRPLGLAFDWLRVEPGPGSTPLLPTATALGYLLGVILGLYAFPRLFGFSSGRSLAVALGGAVVLAAMAATHKLAPVHMATTLGLRPHAFALMALVFFHFRRRSEDSAFSRPVARWVLLAFYLGTTVRLLALFHPEFYYPDVRTHSKFVYLIWTQGIGGFFANHIEHQHRHLLGLQLVGDQWMAFPYPPLLYLLIYPLSLLRLPVDDWMKIVPTFLVGLEALVVYAMACRLGLSGRTAAIASWFHTTAALVAFRLTVASYAAVLGHFWDVLVGLYLLFLFRDMDRALIGVGLALLVSGSLLSYAGGVLVLGFFIPAFSIAAWLWRRRGGDAGRAARTLLWSAAGAFFAIALFYLQYIPELMPGWRDGHLLGIFSSRLLDFRLTPVAAAATAVHRLLLFYGPLFGALVFVGLIAGRKRFDHRLGLPLAFGTLCSFFGLNFLRSGLGATHIFQFSKDDLVLLPLGAIVLANLVDLAAARGKAGRAAATAMLAGWVGWGSAALVRDVRARFLRTDYPPPSAFIGALGRSSVSPEAAALSVLGGSDGAGFVQGAACQMYENGDAQSQEQG